MSELEKRQRDEYQESRKKKIIIQMVVAGILVLATLLTLIPYIILNNNTYVYYAEDGKTEIKVYLGDNSFYEEEYLDANHAYVTELIDRIETKFMYGLVMDAEKVDYKYSYTISAKLNIIDKDSAAPLYDPVFVLKEVRDAESSERELYITEVLDIDYAEYDALAQSFIDRYEMDKATATLVVRMNVTVLGKSETFAEDTTNTYAMEVSIPLLKSATKLTTYSSVPTGEQKILACDSTVKTVLLVLWIIFSVLSVLMGAFIVVFVILTRDKHIDYARRVKKLLSSYKSYIQRVGNKLDFDGYKVLNVLTFQELLEIGDKLQSPVLMYENEDKTKSEFFVATCNGLIYLFVVEVQDDDKIIYVANKDNAAADDEETEVSFAVVTEAEEGVEAIDVQWEEDSDTYRYDPNGEVVNTGDIVRVPTAIENVGEIERDAEVIRGNYFINPNELDRPLKKIIAIVKRKMQNIVVSSDASTEE